MEFVSSLRQPFDKLRTRLRTPPADWLLYPPSLPIKDLLQKGKRGMFELHEWKDEADFWDKVDTASLMEEEEGEWLGPGWIQPASGLCRRCGAQMNRHRADVSVAHGCIVLHEVEFYICPRCGARTLPPGRQEFVVWTEVAVETTAREAFVS